MGGGGHAPPPPIVTSLFITLLIFNIYIFDFNIFLCKYTICLTPNSRFIFVLGVLLHIHSLTLLSETVTLMLGLDV